MWLAETLSWRQQGGSIICVCAKWSDPAYNYDLIVYQMRNRKKTFKNTQALRKQLVNETFVLSAYQWSNYYRIGEPITAAISSNTRHDKQQKQQNINSPLTQNLFLFFEKIINKVKIRQFKPKLKQLTCTSPPSWWDLSLIRLSNKSRRARVSRGKRNHQLSTTSTR